MQQSAAKILLLEDDALVNLDMSRLVEDMGYTVRSSLSLADAVYKVQEDSPDVAILDVKIGSTTSYVLADWLRQRGVPIIFVTAYETVAPPALREAPSGFSPGPQHPSRLKPTIWASRAQRSASRRRADISHIVHIAGRAAVLLNDEEP